VAAKGTRWTIFIVVMVFAAGAYAASRLWFSDRVEVRTAKAEREPLALTVSTNGKVEPVTEFQAHAPFPGVVEHVYVRVGEHVTPNEVLLEMDDADAKSRLTGANLNLTNAELNQQNLSQGGSHEDRIGLTSDLQRSDADVQKAERDLTVLTQLQQKGAASAAEVAAARQRLTIAKDALIPVQQRNTSRYGPLDLSRAAAQLKDAQAQVVAAKAAYNNVVMHSPIAGTVYSIPVNQYDYVPDGFNLMYVANLNHLQVRAYFDEPDVGRLAAGQQVKIIWGAKPDKSWHGHIVLAPTTIVNYGTRSVGECLIAVDDPSDDLLPNTNVTVTVTLSHQDAALSVPREALRTEGGNFVYRVVNGRLVRTPVQIGPIVNVTRAEIVGGLSAGDTVALSATTNRDLTNGLEVVPANP
jgi:HlyD family secretion protein